MARIRHLTAGGQLAVTVLAAALITGCEDNSPARQMEYGNEAAPFVRVTVGKVEAVSTNRPIDGGAPPAHRFKDSFARTRTIATLQGAPDIPVFRLECNRLREDALQADETCVF